MVAAPDGTRRLKAIMFTDIKGYSAMMGVDEQLTVKLVLEHRQIVRECIEIHGGVEHETIGDAFVVLFDSVVNAVRCGADIQNRLKVRNSALPAAEQVWLRIGIHLGDIIVQGDGIYGDGVNVAARVQDKADPGGISITEQVYLQIDGKVDMPFDLQGKVELKNIRNPPNLYKMRLGTAVPRKSSRAALLVALAVAAVGSAGAAVLFLRQPAPAPLPAVVASPPAVIAAPAPAPAADDDRKSEAGRKVAAAMSATGPARVELLRQALTLDPDNSAVQNMLAGALSSLNAPAVVPVGPDAGSAGATGEAVVPPALRPPAARGVHGAAPKGTHDSDLRNNDKAPEPKIRRSIVVE